MGWEAEDGAIVVIVIIIVIVIVISRTRPRSRRGGGRFACRGYTRLGSRTTTFRCPSNVVVSNTPASSSASAPCPSYRGVTSFGWITCRSWPGRWIASRRRQRRQRQRRRRRGRRRRIATTATVACRRIWSVPPPPPLVVIDGIAPPSRRTSGRSCDCTGCP